MAGCGLLVSHMLTCELVAFWYAGLLLCGRVGLQHSRPVRWLCVGLLVPCVLDRWPHVGLLDVGLLDGVCLMAACWPVRWPHVGLLDGHVLAC